VGISLIGEKKREKGKTTFRNRGIKFRGRKGGREREKGERMSTVRSGEKKSLSSKEIPMMGSCGERGG